MSIIERTCVLNRGIVSFINSKGKLSYYCQRGIKELKDDEKVYAIETGIIDPKAFREQVQGLAIAFPNYLRVSFISNLDNIILENYSSLDIIDLAEE